MIRQYLEQRTKLAGHDLLGSFEAGIPTYSVRARAQIEKKLSVPVIAQSTLRLIELGLNSEPDLIEALGVDRDFVRNVLQDLDRSQLARFQFDSRRNQPVFNISSEGKEAIRNQLKGKNTTTIELMVDGITGEIFGPLEARLPSSEDLKKRDAWALHASPGNRPTIESLNADRASINTALQSQPERFGHDDRLLQVLAVDSVNLYYKPVTVLIFRNSTTKKIFLRVFDGYEAELKYEHLLTDRERNGGRVIPDWILAPASELFADSEIIPELKSEIQSVDDIAKKIRAIESDRAELLSAERMTGTARPLITEKSQKIKNLEAQVESLKKIQSGNRVVESDEHRQVLIDALTLAKKLLVIVSPWVGRDATDQEILDLLRGAVQRGVWILIGFGMPPAARKHERVPISPEVEREFEQIQQEPNGNRFIFENWGKTHQKILVCDDQFCVIGSFNFLSYKGGQGLRQEMSALMTDPAFITDVRKRCLRHFKHLPKDVPVF